MILVIDDVKSQREISSSMLQALGYRTAAVSGGEAATQIHLRPDDSGRRIGPFPPGDYTASLMAPEVKPDRHHVPASITSNGTTDIKFTFTPDGMIYGHVAAEPKPENRPAGTTGAHPGYQIGAGKIGRRLFGTGRDVFRVEGSGSG